MTLLYAGLALFCACVLVALCIPLWRAGQKKMVGIILLPCFLATAGLYSLWGYATMLPELAEHRLRMQDFEETVTVSQAIINENPNNLEAWLTLAQAFADAGDYTAAANAYKQCVLLSKGNPLIIMAYAEALIAANYGVVSAQAKKSIDVALMIDKELPVGRYYNAIWLLQQNETEQAMEMMKKLYAELPEDSALKRKINEQIGR